MNITNNRTRLVGEDSQLARLELLLERYPQTSAAEGQEIADLLRQATPLEVGLLSCNPSAWTKVEQYKVDHPRHFRTPRLTIAAWIGVGLLLALAVWMLWDVGLS